MDSVEKTRTKHGSIILAAGSDIMKESHCVQTAQLAAVLDTFFFPFLYFILCEHLSLPVNLPDKQAEHAGSAMRIYPDTGSIRCLIISLHHGWLFISVCFSCCVQTTFSTYLLHWLLYDVIKIYEIKYNKTRNKDIISLKLCIWACLFSLSMNNWNCAVSIRWVENIFLAPCFTNDVFLFSAADRCKEVQQIREQHPNKIPVSLNLISTHFITHCHLCALACSFTYVAFAWSREKHTHTLKQIHSLTNII